MTAVIVWLFLAALAWLVIALLLDSGHDDDPADYYEDPDDPC